MKNRKFLHIILCFFILFALINSNNIYAKYIDLVILKIPPIKVATPILSITNNSSSNATITKDSGANYVFNVSNFELDKVSAIAQNYSLELYSNDLDLSDFNISIEKDGFPLSLNNYKTDSFSFLPDVEQTHIFCINISCLDDILSNITGSIKLRIISEQLQP